MAYISMLCVETTWAFDFMVNAGTTILLLLFPEYKPHTLVENLDPRKPHHRIIQSRSHYDAQKKKEEEVSDKARGVVGSHHDCRRTEHKGKNVGKHLLQAQTYEAMRLPLPHPNPED